MQRLYPNHAIGSVWDNGSTTPAEEKPGERRLAVSPPNSPSPSVTDDSSKGGAEKEKPMKLLYIRLHNQVTQDFHSRLPRRQEMSALRPDQPYHRAFIITIMR